MIKEIEIGGKKYFECPVCGLDYIEKEWAEKCDRWCSTHDSCNLEVIAHSVGALGELQTKGSEKLH